MSYAYDDVLIDAVDLHIHTAPDVIPRSVDALDAARQAQQAGMRAVLFKSHVTDTAARASLASGVTGFAVYGGVVLNYPVGGLNPHAVTETANQGGRCVWMPTTGARNFHRYADMIPALKALVPAGVDGITVLDRGRLRDDVLRVLDVIAARGLMLAGGHLAADEMAAVFTAARERGITRLAVNHGEAPFLGCTAADLVALADLGAFIEITRNGGDDARAALIRDIGVERCFLATDGGSTNAPEPCRILRDLVRGLAAQGFSAPELRHLIVDVPSFLLGLSEEAMPASC